MKILWQLIENLDIVVISCQDSVHLIQIHSGNRSEGKYYKSCNEERKFLQQLKITLYGKEGTRPCYP